MPNVILPTGYETQVQTDMGVTESVLPATAIQSKAALAEALIKQMVPAYADITGDALIFLQSACIARLCALLCPGMPQRLKVQQTDETGYSFRLASVDWRQKQAEFESSVKDYISLALGGEIEMWSAVGVVNNDRLEI